MAQTVKRQSDTGFDRAQGEARFGGDLIRLRVDRARPVGGLTGWKPMMPVTQWSLQKR